MLDTLRYALVWIDSLGVWAAITFILLYTFSAVVFIPGTILTLGAGIIFGLFLGSIYVFIGATLGGTAAFLVGRYFARDWVYKKIENNQKFRVIDQAVSKEGLKIVLLTRLSPVFPFILLNYAYGLTSVNLKDFVIGSIGMIPGTITYVYIGSLAGNLANLGTTSSTGNAIAEWTLRIIGLMATIGVTFYINKIARQVLKKEGLDD